LSWLTCSRTHCWQPVAVPAWPSVSSVSLTTSMDRLQGTPFGMCGRSSPCLRACQRCECMHSKNAGLMWFVTSRFICMCGATHMRHQSHDACCTCRECTLQG
jgi:hypothetical protein